MNIPPITGYQCYHSPNYGYDKGRACECENKLQSPPKMSEKKQDVFVKSVNSTTENTTDKGNNKIGIMYSSGGGTN